MAKKPTFGKKTTLPKPPKRKIVTQEEVLDVVELENDEFLETCIDERDLSIETSVENLDAISQGYTKIQHKSNQEIRKIFDTNFMEYATYVIKDRAIPDVDDGLKPVQRRILWSLFRMDDGKFHKVANAIGHTMQFHPHGDMSIGKALVLLANREVFIDRQGNFGSVITGDENSAFRYIEARLSTLAKDVLFNADITEFVDSYDGRNKEPVCLPAKIPSLLILGSMGMAVGMSTLIPPHNFCEAIRAQIKILKNEPFVLYPDYPQGGLMDVSEYDRGRGRLRVRAKIDRDGRRLVIRELPGDTTTEKLMASIEVKAKQNKIKIQEYHDYTGENVEIEIIPSRGMDPDKLMTALYAYTECEFTIATNILVICENKPVIMTVDQILLRNTEKLLTYLSQELQIKLQRLADKHLARTLERIFVEERLYKAIEQCKTRDAVVKAVYDGLKPFESEFNRMVIDEDVERLLAIPIRRISLFDIQKNHDEINVLLVEIQETLAHLKKLKPYAINYLKDILTKYGHLYPRRTEITTIAKADAKAAALSNIKVGLDRKGSYVGRNIKSDETVTCTEFDRLLCVTREGGFKIIRIPDKLFVDKLYDFRKYDPEVGFCVIYTEKASGKVYWKRFQINKIMTDKNYQLCPPKSRIELLTVRLNAVYTLSLGGRKKQELTLNLWEAPERSAKSRGLLLGDPFESIKFVECMNDIEVFFGNPEVDEVNDEIEDPNFKLDEDENALIEENAWHFSKSELESLQTIAEHAKDLADAYHFSSEKMNILVDETQGVIESIVDKMPPIVVAPEMKPKHDEQQSIVKKAEYSEKEKKSTYEMNVSQNTNVKKAESKSEKPQKGKASDDSKDDWGMIQMELGF